MSEGRTPLPAWTKRLVAFDVGLVVLELGYVGAAVYHLAGLNLADADGTTGGRTGRWMALWVAFLIVPTLLAPWVSLRPILAGEVAKRHRQSLAPPAVEGLLGAFVRLPILAGVWRFGG